MSSPQSQYPLKVVKQDTLVTLVGEMNAAQGVAVAFMPRFGIEITVINQEFQVQVSELDTGHDIRLSRDVAAGMIEALTRLVAMIDERLETSQPTGEDGQTQS